MAFIRFSEGPYFRNPWVEFERLRHSLDQLSRNFIGDEHAPRNRATVFPPLNIFETNDQLIVKAELPGVRAEDIAISIEGDTLTLQGKRDFQKETDVSYHRREIERGNFSRAIGLTTKVDVDAVNARLANGILTITLNKAAEVKPRKINVITE
jgi:HSP20 family protein